MAFSPHWPANRNPLPAAAVEETVARSTQAFATETAALGIEGDRHKMLRTIYVPLAAWLAARKRRGGPIVVGINGAQGAGKSTLCRLLQVVLRRGFGLRAAGFSIDDLYRTRAERRQLARTVHPLLATRGVPGTHDVALGMRTLRALKEVREGQQVAIPAFDKAQDERRPESAWGEWRGPADLVIFEGWCVGATPQPAADLDTPVNDLERREDGDGVWRRYVNARLAGDYAALFAELDLLVMLKVPGMASVFEWRRRQERRLAEQIRNAAGPAGLTISRLMDDAALRRFIMHYERLTRHMLAEMPRRADVVLRLDEGHRISGVHVAA